MTMVSCVLWSLLLSVMLLTLTRGGNLLVHSFYRNKVQLRLQNRCFRNRTSLFKDQIFRGNASLQLTGVEVQDQGRYRCYSSTNNKKEESFINLRVDAPVSKVNMEQVGNRIICSSEGIYPEPDLTWSTRPPSNLNLQNQTSIQQTEQQLYNIVVLILSDTSINASDSETTISCTASNASITGFSLTWRFNHSQIILNQSRADISYTVSEEWRQQVKGVSKSGSLMLQDLSSHHEGIYSCEVSDAEETLITNTFLRREKSQEDSTNVGAIIGGV
ncbi:CD276 antigen-like isoform X1, partial [Lates japonicus]